MGSALLLSSMSSVTTQGASSATAGRALVVGTQPVAFLPLGRLRWHVYSSSYLRDPKLRQTKFHMPSHEITEDTPLTEL